MVELVELRGRRGSPHHSDRPTPFQAAGCSPVSPSWVLPVSEAMVVHGCARTVSEDDFVEICVRNASKRGRIACLVASCRCGRVSVWYMRQYSSTTCTGSWKPRGAFSMCELLLSIKYRQQYRSYRLATVSSAFSKRSHSSGKVASYENAETAELLLIGNFN